MNNFCCIGRLTADPELKITTSGVSVCSFTLAVQRPRVKDTTDFINFVAWRQNAEYVSNYGRKGYVVSVTGVLTSRKYDDKSGAKRTAFEIVCDTVHINAPKTGESDASGVSEAAQPRFDDLTDDDDLPF